MRKINSGDDYWNGVVDKELDRLRKVKEDYDSIFINYSTMGKMSPAIWRYP
jgi:hypothetical protein